MVKGYEKDPFGAQDQTKLAKLIQETGEPKLNRSLAVSTLTFLKIFFNLALNNHKSHVRLT